MFVLCIFVGIYVLKARVLFQMLKIRYEKKIKPKQNTQRRYFYFAFFPFFLFYINSIHRIGKDMHAIRIRKTSMQVKKTIFVQVLIFTELILITEELKHITVIFKNQSQNRSTIET